MDELIKAVDKIHKALAARSQYEGEREWEEMVSVAVARFMRLWASRFGKEVGYVAR